MVPPLARSGDVIVQFVPLLEIINNSLEIILSIEDGTNIYLETLKYESIFCYLLE